MYFFVSSKKLPTWGLKDIFRVYMITLKEDRLCLQGGRPLDLIYHIFNPSHLIRCLWVTQIGEAFISYLRVRVRLRDSMMFESSEWSRTIQTPPPQCSQDLDCSNSLSWYIGLLPVEPLSTPPSPLRSPSPSCPAHLSPSLPAPTYPITKTHLSDADLKNACAPFPAPHHPAQVFNVPVHYKMLRVKNSGSVEMQAYLGTPSFGQNRSDRLLYVNPIRTGLFEHI